MLFCRTSKPKNMKTRVELFGTSNVPVIDNGVYAKKFTRRAKTYAQRVENMAKRIDFVAAANHLPAGQIIQFSACQEARGIQYGDADSQWEDAMQINVADKDGCRHYKSVKLVGRPTFCCEKRCYYSESGWLHKDADGYYHYEQLLGDDDYLNGRKVQAACLRWAELTGDFLAGKPQMMQVSLKIDGKSPFTTAAWVQTVTDVNGVTLYFVILIDNGKIQQQEMNRLRLSIEDLFEELREKDVFSINDVAWAIMETNGKLSIIKKPEKDSPTNQLLGLSPPDTGMEVVIISDGEYSDSSLRLCGKNRQWVQEILKRRGIFPKQIFIMTANSNGDYTIIPRENMGLPTMKGGNT